MISQHRWHSVAVCCDFKKSVLLCVGFLELYGRHLITEEEVFTLKAMGIRGVTEISLS